MSENINILKANIMECEDESKEMMKNLMNRCEEVDKSTIDIQDKLK
jgi:hypothetical protein